MTAIEEREYLVRINFEYDRDDGVVAIERKYVSPNGSGTRDAANEVSESLSVQMPGFRVYATGRGSRRINVRVLERIAGT